MDPDKPDRPMEFYARSLEGLPWQPLEQHLKNVAGMARDFAEEFGAGDWGYLAGLWCDLGKDKINGLGKSRKCSFSVIPAKAGTQYFQAVIKPPDPVFQRGDGFLRNHQN